MNTYKYDSDLFSGFEQNKISTSYFEYAFSKKYDIFSKFIDQRKYE